MCLIILLIIGIKLSVEKCLIRDQISSSQVGYYTGDALPLSKEGIEIFKKRCSSMLKKGYKKGDKILTCCSENQLTVLEDNIAQLDSIVTNCDVCSENIQMLSCFMLCSENQSEFAKVHQLETNKSIVDALTLAYSYKFVEGVYNSCVGIKEPVTKLSIVNLLCSVTPIPVCNDPISFVKSLFSMSLFNVTPIIVKTDKELPPDISKSLNPDAKLCNQTYNNGGKIIKNCRCIDCEATCPVLPDFKPYKPYLFFNMFTIYQTVTASIFIVAFLIYSFLLVKFVISYLRESLRTGIGIDDDFEYRPLTSTNIVDEDIMFQPHISEENKINSKMSRFIQKGLYKWGYFVASHRTLFLFLPLIVIILIHIGLLKKMKMTTNPIDMWSPANSVFRKQKEFFDRNFGPFYRTEQIIIKSKDANISWVEIEGTNRTIGPIIKKEIISEIFKLQEAISKLSYKTDSKTITLEDICFKALEPVKLSCTMFSVSQYFQNSLENFHKLQEGVEWIAHLDKCILSPARFIQDVESCLSDISAPVLPELVFGGYNKTALEANTFVITYVITNYENSAKNIHAAGWESHLVKFLENYKSPHFELSFNTERSIEDELNKEASFEVVTTAASYIIMVLYVSLSLGRFKLKNFKIFLINQKILLGAAGVLFVFLSVTCTLSLFNIFDMKLNMIVLEVLPFLLLAVGVDNIFLLVHEYRRVKAISSYNTSIERIIGETLAGVGEGMIASFTAQLATFFIGAYSNMPVIRIFSIAAAVGLIVNFFIQFTLFLCLFSIDCFREQRRSPDIIWCVTFKDVEDDDFQDTSLTLKIFKFLSKIVLNRMIKPVILLIFLLIWASSIILIPSVDIGLDQTVALPKDSYLFNYFEDVFTRLKTGPPVYFMIDPGYDYYDKKKRDMICSGPDCNPYSLTNIIYQSSRQSNSSKIATPADSWIDNYISWLQPSTRCCNYALNQSSKHFCDPTTKSSSDDCQPCLQDSDSGPIFPSRNDFYEFLPWFLNHIPSPSCIFGGKPLFGKLVRLNPEYYNNSNLSISPIYSSAFMAYHTAITSSDSLTEALKAVLSLSKQISDSLNHHVVPYSLFYIFYESYLSIRTDTLVSFAMTFVIIFVINLLVYGFEPRITILMTFISFIMVIVDIGLMYVLKINLNPVSLMNLIMFVGLNMEFISHITRTYISVESLSKQVKAKTAFIYTGSSVFSGIAITKFLGVFILSFSSSKLFRDYFFKMFSSAILVAAFHGIVVLPILLSYFGPVNRLNEAPEIEEYSSDSEE